MESDAEGEGRRVNSGALDGGGPDEGVRFPLNVITSLFQRLQKGRAPPSSKPEGTRLPQEP
jgi:hypothetical protein